MAYSKKAKQDWTIGNVVRVGFVDDLEVLEKIATPKNYLPDQYVLRQRRTGNLYSFVPHNGLSRCWSLEQARAW
jgi:hypothetical protein